MAHDVQAVARGKGHSGISWLFCALVFFAPFIIPRMFYDFSVVSKEAFIQIGTLAILALWMFRNNRRVRFPACFPYIVIFLVYVWFTLAWAVNPFEGFSTALHWSVSSLAVLIVFNIVNKDHLLLTIFLSGVAVATIGLLQHYAGFDYFQQVVKPSSTFANKNFAAHYVAACLPLGLYFSGKHRAWLVGIASFLMWVYVSTACNTRAATLAVFAAICFGLAVCLYRRKWPRFSTVIMVMLILISNNYIQVAGDDIGIPKFASKGYQSPSRIVFWKNTARMAIDYPAGVGLGNFKVVYPAFGEVTTKTALEDTHNEYLQLWAETGYVGIILLALAFAGTFMSIDKNNAGMAALIAICVVAAFSFPMRLPNIPFVGACILGAVSK